MFKTLLISIFTLLSMVSCGAYAACRPVTIVDPNGNITVCQICNDGKVVICN